MLALLIWSFLQTEMTDFSTLSYTVFIAISAQPRISAHLEKAPILKAEIVIKLPTPNKRPPPPPPHPIKISVHPHPHPTDLSDNDIEIEIK